MILGIIALWVLLGWVRFERTLALRDVIISLLGPALFGYLLLAGLTWGLMGLPVLWGLLTRASWAPLALQSAAVLYPAIYWLERLLLWQDPYAQRNWPFMLLLTLLWAGLVWWGLRAANQNKYFAKDKDRKEVDHA